MKSLTKVAVLIVAGSCLIAVADEETSVKPQYVDLLAQPGSKQNASLEQESALRQSQNRDRYPDGLFKWSIDHSIATRYFVTSQMFPGYVASEPRDPIVRSPDGLHFFFVMRRGDVSCDCNEYEMQVFSARAIKAALDQPSGMVERPAPLRTVTMRTSSGGSGWGWAIGEARWESERTILFVGEQVDGAHHVYRFNVSSGELHQLTDSRYDYSVSYATRGDSIVYVGATIRHPKTRLDSYPMVEILGNELQQLVFPEEYEHTVLVSYRGSPARPVITGTGTNASSGPWISPNGKWAVMKMQPSGVPMPTHWARYEGINASGTARFMLIDVQEGRGQPVFDAPNGVATLKDRGSWRLSIPETVFWSHNGEQAILVNTAVPLIGDEERHRSMAYLVAFEAQTGRWLVLQPLELARGGLAQGNDRLVSRVKEVGWLQEGRELLVRHETPEGKPAAGTVYRYRDGRWYGREAPASLKLPAQRAAELPISVALRESANDPPVIVASHAGKSIELTDVNPALDQVWRAPVQTVRWRERDGKIESGGLMLPRYFSRSSPPPLVIHAYYYRPDLFRPDSNQPTAYAAQPLVSTGMAVLSLNIPGYDDQTQDTPREGPLFVERIDTAVQSLASQGLIDSARVGIIGFSRGGLMTYYAITNPGQTALAAAVIADSVTYSYFEYVKSAALSPGGSVKAYEGLYGGGTFWQNKAAWLEHAPGFNVDRVRTPALFAYNNKQSAALLSALEIIGAFRLNQRPFEFLLFPKGTHQLQRPRERAASMQATFDWMSFWLQGNAPADPERAARWQAMKAAWKSTSR